MTCYNFNISQNNNKILSEVKNIKIALHHNLNFINIFVIRKNIYYQLLKQSNYAQRCMISKSYVNFTFQNFEYIINQSKNMNVLNFIAVIYLGVIIHMLEKDPFLCSESFGFFLVDSDWNCS